MPILHQNTSAWIGLRLHYWWLSHALHLWRINITFPRLKLLAAIVNSRLLRFIVDSLSNLKINWVLCWSDRSITLYWIQIPNAPWKPFIANRVSEITSMWESSLWRHCPGETNPGDATTRGLNVLKLVNDNLRWNEPSWLKMPQESWPVNPSLEPSKAKVKRKERKLYK